MRMGARAIASVHALVGKMFRGMVTQKLADVLAKGLFFGRKGKFHQPFSSPVEHVRSGSTLGPMPWVHCSPAWATMRHGGSKEICNVGAYTLAQSEKTRVVWGMPVRQAARRGQDLTAGRGRCDRPD